MTTTPARGPLPILVAGVIGLAGPALMVLATLHSRPLATSITVGALVIVAIVIWIVWMRSHQQSKAAVVSFALVSTVTMALGNGPAFYGIVWVACLMLGITFAQVAVVWSYAGALVALVLILHVSGGSPADLVLFETVSAMLFAGSAAAASAVLRESLRTKIALQEALVERDAANAELRNRLDSDRELVVARERERTARELHDVLGHRLTAIGLSLDYVARVDDSVAARDEVRRARDLVTETLDAMRRVVRAMHPVELSALRDADAFRAVAQAFRGSGIDIRVSTSGDDSSLSREQSLLLLRFAQEGLTNVVRHSDASVAELRIVVGDSKDPAFARAAVTAELEDWGETPRAATCTEGFGLRSLRARAEELDGTLDANPTARGFRLSLALPAAAPADSSPANTPTRAVL